MRREVEQLSEVTALQETEQVFTFFLPINTAFSSLRNRGSFDGTVLKGHIIPNQVMFLRTFNESVSELREKVPGAMALPTLLQEASSLIETSIGYFNNTGEGM